MARDGVLWAAVLLGCWAATVAAVAAELDAEPGRTIAFSVNGRPHFGFDLYSVLLPDSWLEGDARVELGGLRRLTDGVSVNYNGQFVDGAQGRRAVLDRLRAEAVPVGNDSNVVVFVSERSGSARVYYTAVGGPTDGTLPPVAVVASLPFDGPVLLDRPTVASDSVVYASTAEAAAEPRQSWTAVYATGISTGISARKGSPTRRLTPRGIADFSPAVSPSGEWVAVASYEGGGGFAGEATELRTAIYAFRATDGGQRRLIARRGGWPSWGGDGRTLFFHRRADDGWWSIFRVTLSDDWTSGINNDDNIEERITPPGVHVVTPAASASGDWIAVATRRPGSVYRHIEILNLETRSLKEVTKPLSPESHHYNPFVSGTTVGFHRCRCAAAGAVIPLVDRVRSGDRDVAALLRVDGSFPAFSPDGNMLAFVRNAVDDTVDIPAAAAGVYVANADGSGARRVFRGGAFAVSWHPTERGVLYASSGTEFASNKPVQIIAIDVDGGGRRRSLTTVGNNAFPSMSPDGTRMVFRSKRSGFKNLWVMNAERGEAGGLWRLTEGNWTDTHPEWSPVGDWIAFTSNREDPATGDFGICSVYLIRPDGTGLRRVVHSGRAGLVVHQKFSPDGRRLVFASDMAGVSAEPVAAPHHFQPYGDLFSSALDGSDVRRLTHTADECGTPSWGPPRPLPPLSTDGQPLRCDFDDVRWLDSPGVASVAAPHVCAGTARVGLARAE